MTVDHRADSGLLCLGGGTGIAPIKAMVEDVASQGRPAGSRSSTARAPTTTSTTSTRCCASRSATTGSRCAPWSRRRAPGPALAGQLPEAVRRYGPWRSFDGYLSGPPGMIRSGVETLVGLGIPSHRIRHDSLDALMPANG